MVDAQQSWPWRGAGGGAGPVGLQRPDELIALTPGLGVRAGDKPAQVGDEIGPDDCVAFALFEIVADHEPSRARTAVAAPRSRRQPRGSP